ncbi:MAG: general secretion pathway protein GspK [Azoarcus sp.]|nr:general secretion pathway protein GspK [Azoarcus sp.]
MRAHARRGVALIAVLWMVAALALLVAGMQTMARGQFSEARLHLDAGRATALGDAAIQLAVLDWMSANPAPDRLRHARYGFDNAEIEVEIVPASGYVDLNAAPEALLQALFVHGVGLDADAALQLAQRIVDWRDVDDEPQPHGAETPAYAAAGVKFRPRNGRFVVPEDLMQVIGVDFDLFARIRPFITVWSTGGAGVNPYAASGRTLLVLCQGDGNEARRIAAARDAGQTDIDTVTLDQTFLRAGGMGNVLHVTASIAVGNGRRAVRGRWVLTRAHADGTPWQTIRAEPVRFALTEAGGS